MSPDIYGHNDKKSCGLVPSSVRIRPPASSPVKGDKMEKTNPVLKKTISKAEEKCRKKGIGIWGDVAQRLKKSRRNKKAVNIAKINRHSEDGETVLVPGKVTGYGTLDKKITVAAFGFSGKAKQKINEAGETISILDLLDKNPKGKNVRILEG